MPSSTNRTRFLESLADVGWPEPLFESLPDVVFCIKDLEFSYISINRAFLERLNLRHKEQVIGRTARDIFPSHLARTYEAQDRSLFESGKPMHDKLELISTPEGSLGWYVAEKIPLLDRRKSLIGLAGISRDLQTPNADAVEYAELAEVVDFVQSHYHQPIKIPELARRAGLSPTQLDRRIRKIFRISTKHFITKTRIEAASISLLGETRSIADIAMNCGYCDQSAFSRQFKATVGMTPSEYRESKSN